MHRASLNGMHFFVLFRHYDDFAPGVVYIQTDEYFLYPPMKISTQ